MSDYWLNLDYPKIPSDGDIPSGACVAFEKLDGTNLGWPWARGFGFGPPTTRRMPLSKSDEQLRRAFGLFKRLRYDLDRILARSTAAGSAKLFFEYLGADSFAGMHVLNSPKRLVLIDAAISPVGFLGPEEFLRIFSNQTVELPRVLYRGRSPGQAISEVLSGRHGPMEGVVVKGGTTGSVWMLKAKTDAWKQRLREAAQTGRWTAHDGIERSVDEDCG